MMGHPQEVRIVATHQVNLDCLIQREDFESSAEGSIIGSEPLFKVEELQRDKLYFSVLRKPDFQRMTANWSPQMIVGFIRSFLDGDLIPSIIIWHSKKSGKVFVIDGAHRLSALVAWANDDYGDGEISRKAWNYDVPRAQADLHRKTKTLVDTEIGTFGQLFHIGLHGSSTDDQKIKRARAIATRQPHIQRVDGDAEKAEKSFFTINSNPITIDDTELSVIRARAKPNVIATRALIAAGKGHQYWAKFTERSKQIEQVAADANTLLFGDIFEIGAQSPDLPRAGQPYSDEAFKMVLDLVNRVNKLTPAMWRVASPEDVKTSRSKAAKVTVIDDDRDGSATVECLEKVSKTARLVTGNDPGSLGLDHAVYSYGGTGKFHPVAYLAAVEFAQELQSQDKLKAFTTVRAKLEEFLVRHKSFINKLVHGKGSRSRPLESLVLMHRCIFDALLDGKTTDSEIRSVLDSEPKLKQLQEYERNDGSPVRKRFQKNVVRAKVVETTLAGRERCAICKARMSPSARTKDHKNRMADGGRGEIENLQFAHAYCNNSREALPTIDWQP